MADKPNKITVKTTGEFELRDPIANIDITQEPQEVLETSFVSQMLGLKRLEKVSGETTQEWDPNEFNQNPLVGEALPTRDSEVTIRELNEQTEKRTRGRPVHK